MAALDFTEIAEAHLGDKRDQFELFAREFLVCEGFNLLEGPDRGPDDGRDLIVEERRTGPGGQSVLRWLVSCKHKAHSGSSVTQTDDMNLRDRLDSHKCQGFIAFYSTIPSSGLAFQLRALESKFELIVYDSESLERALLGNPRGRSVALRFLPQSYNRWLRTSRISNSPDPQMARNDYFLREPHTDLSEASLESAARQLPLLVVIYDPDHSKLSKLDYALGYFMEYETTRRLVDQHFVPVLGKSNESSFAALVPEDNPLELCLLVIMDWAHNVLRREPVYANPEVGLKQIREEIAKWSQASLPSLDA